MWLTRRKRAQRAHIGPIDRGPCITVNVTAWQKNHCSRLKGSGHILTSSRRCQCWIHRDLSSGEPSIWSKSVSCLNFCHAGRVHHQLTVNSPSSFSQPHPIHPSSPLLWSMDYDNRLTDVSITHPLVFLTTLLLSVFTFSFWFPSKESDYP